MFACAEAADDPLRRSRRAPGPEWEFRCPSHGDNSPTLEAARNGTSKVSESQRAHAERRQLGQGIEAYCLVCVLDLSSAEYVVENRGETAQSHESSGVKLHIELPLAKRWRAR